MLKAFFIAMLVTGALAMTTDAAVACQFNTDCNPGSQCVKNGGLYGVCAGGIQPGNDNDRQPVYSPMDPNRTTGNTCQFNTDCGPGAQCAKTSGIYGVCMRR